MGVDGFHVYYELVNETRLRAWRNQGMTELFLPMPGTRRLMVCPLEVALRRGYGECRMVEQDSPQLKVIGDAREVINIQRVYQRGDVVWSGPGSVPLKRGQVHLPAKTGSDSLTDKPPSGPDRPCTKPSRNSQRRLRRS